MHLFLGAKHQPVNYLSQLWRQFPKETTLALLQSFSRFPNKLFDLSSIHGHASIPALQASLSARLLHFTHNEEAVGLFHCTQVSGTFVRTSYVGSQVAVPKKLAG